MKETKTGQKELAVISMPDVWDGVAVFRGGDWAAVADWIDELRETRAALLEALEAAMRISELWASPVCSQCESDATKEAPFAIVAENCPHAGECEALRKMHARFASAIAKTTGDD